MNNANRNAWNARTGHDTLLNGALIAVGVVGLLLALLDGPAPDAASLASGIATVGSVVVVLHA